MSPVAVFDLDRTLIAGSSAQTFSQMLRDVGVELPTPPGQSTYFALYERFGEDPITMRVARHAARLFKNQSVARVATAGRLAADVLASQIKPQAQAELSKRRADGAKLLLATTAPHELAAPFADAAGFDDVLCTRYQSVDGVFVGTNETRYVWGQDKANLVAEWAGLQAIDLTESWAYSDSWYDVPLLQLVGNPTPVNADPRLAVYARAKRWPRKAW